MKRQRAASAKANAPYKKPRRVGAYAAPAAARPGVLRRTQPSYSNKLELKGVDGTIDLASGSILNTTNTNAGIATINCVQPGTGSFNRVGRKIRMKSLRVRGVLNYFQSNVPATYVNGLFRMTVVYDKQPNGNTPSFDAIFGNTTQAGAESSIIIDGLRYDNTSRFQVLKDITICSDVQAVSAAIPQEQTWHFDEFIKLKGLETVYSGQSNPCTIADIASGALFIVIRADTNTAGAVFTITNSTVRLRYYD